MESFHLECIAPVYVSLSQQKQRTKFSQDRLSDTVEIVNTRRT